MYQSENQSLLFIVILGSLTAFGPLAIDMFLPGLPIISHDFDISASTTQLTISFFMIGLALGNFLAGPISDITGRKKPLIFSLIIFTIASLGIIFVTNIWIMIILRFIQGLTGGAGAVISRAIASDMYSGNALTKFLIIINARQWYCTNYRTCAWRYHFKLWAMANCICNTNNVWDCHVNRNFI